MLGSHKPGGPSRGKAELDAGEEELALFPELVLLGRPPADHFLGDVVAAGDVARCHARWPR
jgi:hypothetical protein